MAEPSPLPTLAQLRAWLETRPADELYWAHSRQCPVARYLQDTTHDDWDVSQAYALSQRGAYHPMTDGLYAFIGSVDCWKSREGLTAAEAVRLLQDLEMQHAQHELGQTEKGTQSGDTICLSSIY